MELCTVHYNTVQKLMELLNLTGVQVIHPTHCHVVLTQMQ